MPSRQERRQAGRDAAKRAAAAAREPEPEPVNVVPPAPVADWTTQTEDPKLLFRALGAATLRQKAATGDREAQFSLGAVLSEVCNVAAAGTPLGGAGVSVRSALCTETFSVDHQVALL